MSELWLCDDMRPEWRIWIAKRPGVLDKKTQRLFACCSVRQVWYALTDERSRRAVEVAERYAVGTATEAELADARDAACTVCSTDAYTLLTTKNNAAYAAYFTAAIFAFEAVRNASLYAALAAAPAIDAAKAAQAEWLLAYAKPNF
jgi:uncharacterized paraquat-inducible protein A